MLLSGYSLAMMISVPLVGSKLARIGRKNAVSIGVCVMALSTLLCGVAYYFSNFYIFIAVSFLARLIQGIADGLICVGGPSIILIEYPNNCGFYIGV